MVFDERGGTNDRLEANAINFANAIRDALDLLNNVPNGYWKKYPAEYNKIVKIKDL